MATVTWHQPSPVGLLTVEVGDSGIRTVELGVLAAGSVARATDPGARTVAEALDAYFAGDLDALDGLPVDLAALRPFSRAVLEALRAVPAGSVTTYGELARAAGSPGASRAVGQVVGSNPVPLVVPCHRVVASGGGLGGFSAGLDRKRWLLAHEGVPARPGGWEPRRRRPAPLAAPA